MEKWVRKKKTNRRALYGLLGAAVAVTAVGSVAAKEVKPYKVTELRLAQGSTDYDLMEGITYDKEKYELSVMDLGDFDINVLGKYTIEYSLAPITGNAEELGTNAEIKYESSASYVQDNDGSNETIGENSETEEGQPWISKVVSRFTGRTYAAETDQLSGAVENIASSSEASKPTDTEYQGPTDAAAGENPGMPNTNRDEQLDDADGTIEFSRVVRVVSALDQANIEYDAAHLEIPEDAELYSLKKKTASDSNAERNDEQNTATDSDAQTEITELAASGEDSEDGILIDGIEYELVLKKPELILDDVFFTNADGKKQARVKVTVKDDSDLKTAVRMEQDENNLPKITGLEAGLYRVELAAVDPATREEITCEREITIVAGKKISFDAPVLYIGTRNTSYDLTSGMLALDENGGPVEPIYVLNEEELLAAKEEVRVKATPSNAEGSTEKAETEETETEETVTEVRLKKGTYHVTLGAKHPVSGDEFTVEREVRVVDGYYIYAPTLEIAAGSTDYDLLQGVEVKNDEGTTANVEVKIKDSSELLRAAEEFETMSAESTEDENNFAADTVTMYSENSDDEKVLSGNPALKEGSYSITLTANDPDTGEEIITNRSISVRASRANYSMKFKAFNGAEGSIPYGLGGMPPFYEDNGYTGPTDIGKQKWNYYPQDPFPSTREQQTYVYAPTKTTLATHAGATQMVWRWTTSKALVNHNVINTKASWENAFGKGAGLKEGKMEPDVTVTTTAGYLDLTYLDEFKTMDKTISPDKNNGVGGFFFNDWDGSRSIMIDGENKYLYVEAGHPEDGTGSWSDQIIIPEGQFGLKGFKTSLSSNSVHLIDKDLFFNLKHQNSHLYLKLIATGLSWYEGLGYLNGTAFRRNGTIYLRGTATDQNGNLGSSVFIQAPPGGSGIAPSYVIDSVGNIYMDTTDGGFAASCLILNGGNTYLDTTGNAYFHGICLAAGHGYKLTIGGDGEIRFRVKPYSAYGTEDRFKGVINAANIVLNSDVTITKPSMLGNDRQGKDSQFINLESNIISNGYVIKATRGEGVQDIPLVDLQEGELYALSKGSKLDATDFHVAKPDESADENNMYFTSTDRGTKIVAKTLKDEAPICVEDANGNKSFYKTYTKALTDGLQGKSGACKITNLVEREFTKADAEALKDLSKRTTNVTKLTFSSGTRTTDKDIDHGLYRVRARKQILELPAGVEVTFENIVLKYAQGENSEIKYAQKDGSTLYDQNLVFVKNGGTLTFGDGVYFLAGDNDDVGKATVYGGSDGKPNGNPVNITINSGSFKSVYGGSRGTNGTHSGTATITIRGTATIEETLSGGNDTNTTKQNGENSEITIESKLAVKNIYDYDKLTIASAGDDNATTVLENLNSERTESNNGYTGETILMGGSALFLEGDKPTYVRKMGSLKLDGNAKQNAKLHLVKTTEGSDKSNKTPVVLTKEDPLNSANTGNRIEVAYRIKQGTTVYPEEGDVIFNLQGVPDDPQKKEQQVSTDHLVDMFVNSDNKREDSQRNSIAMRAKPDARTIVIVKASVGLSTWVDAENKYSDPKPYITLKEALEALEENEAKAPNSSYRINFFGKNYTFSTDDQDTMKRIRENTSPNEILWTSKVDATGRDLPTAQIVSPAGDLTFFGNSSIVKDMTLKFTQKQSIYADGKPLKISTGVNVVTELETVPKPDLYGGSEGKKVTSTELIVQSGTFGAVYGGGNNGGADSTSVVIGVDPDDHAAPADLADPAGFGITSIYGGSRNATTGTTNTVIMVPNTDTKSTFSFKTVSGFGTDAGDTLTKNVTGTAAVTLKQASPNQSCTTTVEKLSGFTQLDLGDVKGASNHQKFEVTGQFDSDVTNGTDLRSDNVTLNASDLITPGTSGHIGNLKSMKGSVLTVSKSKSNNKTSPLLVDGNVTLGALDDGNVTEENKERIQLRTTGGETASGDIMLTFTDGNNADERLYLDGSGKDLAVVKKRNELGTQKMDIELVTPLAHTVEAFVEYTDTDPTVDDQNSQTQTHKRLNFVYNSQNEHKVKGGYVIAMPKGKVNEADAKLYTHINDNFKVNGAYSGNETIYEIKWNRDEPGTGATGKTDEIPIEKDKWYIAHIVCENQDVYSGLVDVTAPRQAKECSVQYDFTSGTYTVSVTLMDPTAAKNELPTGEFGMMYYNAHGLKQYAWAIGDTNGNTSADQQAKEKVIAVDPNKKSGIREVKIPDKAVQASDEGVYTFTVDQNDLKKTKGQNVIWVYGKDKVNNTVRFAIPMSEEMIDITVPLRVSLVAIKKNAADANKNEPKLLAPTCYIKNNGTTKVNVAVSGFTEKKIADEHKDKSGLELVDKDKTDTFTNKQISLFVKKDAILTNVKKLAEKKDDVLGTGPMEIGNVEAGKLLDFTFDAGYNPTTIVETTNWLTHEMSYNVSLVKEPNP